MAQDIELATDLLDDVSEVINELGNPVKLVQVSFVENDDPTADNTITTEYETLGVIFSSKNSAKDGLHLVGQRNALIDLKALNGVIPKVEDSVIDDDGITYKVIDVEIYKIAGIKVAAELKMEI